MAEPYLWKPTTDLPADTTALTTGELDALRLVWEDQREVLEQGGALEHFHQALRREWAIETGIVEGVYSIDRGTTQILIGRGIDASLIPHEADGRDPVLVAAMVQDHADALEGVFAFVKGERVLSAGYVKELHAALLRHQETHRVVDELGNLFEKKLEKGSYKQLPNNPTRPNGSLHNYCPPEHVASEMDRMVSLHQEHVSRGVPPEVQAAWLHHVFTLIHPFEDGNGRVARAIATLIFLKAGWFPLVVTRDDRSKYIESLEQADQGSLAPLVSFFTEIQKRSLLKAMRVASEVHPAKTVDEVVSAIRADLVTKGRIIPKEWDAVKTVAQALLNSALGRLNEVARKLQAELPGSRFSTGTGGPGDFPAVQELATKLGYAANLKEFHQWTALTSGTGDTFRFVVSLHGLGRQFRGLVAGLAFIVPGEGPPAEASGALFQCNYRESAAEAEKRFLPWLESAIVSGLSLWRQRL